MRLHSKILEFIEELDEEIRRHRSSSQHGQTGRQAVYIMAQLMEAKSAAFGALAQIGDIEIPDPPKRSSVFDGERAPISVADYLGTIEKNGDSYSRVMAAAALKLIGGKGGE